MTAPPSAFDDRTVTLDGGFDALTQVASVLGSRTRLAVLRALMDAKEPLHINELARRVGVDASPVRTHLELLLKAGIVEEVGGSTGRERRFETRLRNVRLTLEGVERTVAPEKSGPPPKSVVKLQKRLAAIARETAVLETKARRVKAEIEAEWRKAAGT